MTVQGDPALVAVCSCTCCQRRTGSVYGVSAYFLKETQLRSIEGTHKSFHRTSQRGRKFEQHFCHECGPTVFWYGEFLPDKIGVAVGCFADLDFPAPDAAVWDANRHRWVPLPEGLPTYDEQLF